MVSMVTDHRVPKKYAGRLVLQEYDAIKKKMTGPVREIYQAEEIFLEGPIFLSGMGGIISFRQIQEPVKDMGDHTTRQRYMETV